MTIDPLIPGQDVLHRLMDVYLSAELQEKAAVLAIVNGKGPELVPVTPSHPDWQWTAVDWNEGSLESLPPDTPFDAATLSLVLHFLSDPDEKLALLTEVADRLNPGAPLFLSSYVGDPTATRTKKLFDLTLAWAIQSGMDPKAAAAQLTQARTDMHMVSEERIKILLREAGFIDVQRVYQGLLIGAWVARTQRA